MQLDKFDFHSVLEWEGYLEAGKTFPHSTASGNKDYDRGRHIREIERSVFVQFSVTAGRYYSNGEMNTKFIRMFNSAAHALEAYESVKDYPWAELDLRIYSGDVTTAPTVTNIFGGRAEKKEAAGPCLHKTDYAVLRDYYLAEARRFREIGEHMRAGELYERANGFGDLIAKEGSNDEA